MKILLLGDIVGTRTVDYLQKNLWSLRKENKIDMVIANGENATEIMGLSPDDAETLFASGVVPKLNKNDIKNANARHQKSLVVI